MKYRKYIFYITEYQIYTIPNKMNFDNLIIYYPFPSEFYRSLFQYYVVFLCIK